MGEMEGGGEEDWALDNAGAAGVSRVTLPLSSRRASEDPHVPPGAPGRAPRRRRVLLRSPARRSRFLRRLPPPSPREPCEARRSERSSAVPPPVRKPGPGARAGLRPPSESPAVRGRTLLPWPPSSVFEPYEAI